MPDPDLSQLKLSAFDAPEMSEPETPEAPPSAASPESPPREVSEESAPSHRSSVVASEMRRWGYDISDDATDDDVREYVESLGKEADEAEQLRRKIQQYESLLSQRTAESEKPKEQPKAEAAEPEAPAYPAKPTIDDSVTSIIRTGQASGHIEERGGLYHATDAAYMPFVQQANEYIRAMREWRRPLEDDPYGFVAQAAEPALKKMLSPYEEKIAALQEALDGFKQARQQESQDTFWEKNADHYFQKDADGNFVRDDEGRHVGTVAWEAYAKAYEDGRRFGIPDENLHAYAAEHSLNVEAAPKQTQKEKKVTFRNRLKDSGNGKTRTRETPVERPAARPTVPSGETPDQKLRNVWADLMSESTAERI